MHRYKKDFPLLSNRENFVYFDNASTTQKPYEVIDAITGYYQNYCATVHRGIYSLAEDATTLYENARNTIALHVGADPDEIIFTKGATEGINFIAQTWALDHLTAGDEILLSQLEHHSNLLPWQRLVEQRGVRLVFIPVLPNGLLDLSQLNNLISERTKLVSIIHVSNAVGTHVDIVSIIKAVQQYGAKVLIDACQSIPHQKINIHELGADFLVFSGHKVLGPTGIGVLYIKKELHKEVKPYQLGGGMVFEASYGAASWLESPQRYEAGTPPIAQAIGLGVAFQYLTKINFDELQKHEAALCSTLIEGLQALPGFIILGPLEQLKKQGSLVSFYHKTIHAHDVAAYLNKYSICVRSGHYCAQPLASTLGIDASIRASFYLYNSLEEVDYFLSVLKKINSHG